MHALPELHSVRFDFDHEGLTLTPWGDRPVDIRGLKLHRPDVPASRRREEAERVLTAVGLSPASEVLDRFPYELSGTAEHASCIACAAA
jgi:ABC-type dipeptide/oligopeptide/nickel transport system ATPase component